MAGFRRFQQQYLPFLPSGKQIREGRDHLLHSLGIARTHHPLRLLQQPELLVPSVLPFVVSNVVLEKQSLSFLQIGAYDGVIGDDLRQIIEGYPTRGIMVEPQPSAFARLSDRYDGSESITLINAAIDRESGERDFFVPTRGDAEFASFDRDHLIKHGLRPSEIESRKVTCLSVDDLLGQAGWDSVDLIQVDAEGYDYQILSSIDFERLKPAIIRFEFRHFDARQLDESIERFVQLGYQFFVEELDIIAVRPLAQNAASCKQIQAA